MIIKETCQIDYDLQQEIFSDADLHREEIGNDFDTSTEEISSLINSVVDISMEDLFNRFNYPLPQDYLDDLPNLNDVTEELELEEDDGEIFFYSQTLGGEYNSCPDVADVYNLLNGNLRSWNESSQGYLNNGHGEYVDNVEAAVDFCQQKGIKSIEEIQMILNSARENTSWDEYALSSGCGRYVENVRSAAEFCRIVGVKNENDVRDVLSFIEEMMSEIELSDQKSSDSLENIIEKEEYTDASLEEVTPALIYPEYAQQKETIRLNRALNAGENLSEAAKQQIITETIERGVIVDNTYSTTRYDQVRSYDGEGFVDTSLGQVFVKGHRHEGDAGSISKQGYIEIQVFEPKKITLADQIERLGDKPAAYSVGEVLVDFDSDGHNPEYGDLYRSSLTGEEIGVLRGSVGFYGKSTGFFGRHVEGPATSVEDYITPQDPPQDADMSIPEYYKDLEREYEKAYAKWLDNYWE